jgi:hypothetical protein
VVFLVNCNVFAMEQKHKFALNKEYVRYVYNTIYNEKLKNEIIKKLKEKEKGKEKNEDEKEKEVKKKKYSTFVSLSEKNQKKVRNVCNKDIAYWEGRTAPQSYYNKMFGGGSLLGIAGFFGACSYKCKELLNYFDPFPMDSEQSSMIKKLAAGVSVMASIIGGYYALRGLYDWANNESNLNILNRHKSIKSKLSPEDTEKEPEIEKSIKENVGEKDSKI